MDKMKMESVDMTEKNIEKIGELFPSCITEAKDENGNLKKAINFEMLKQLLSKDIIDGDEAYEFTWVGKKASIVEANKPIRKTLRPCKEESVNWDDTENLYIEGDNLEVLKLLQESYLGKVKMIYIDPPYNTGNDFIYNDDFKMTGEEYADETGELDEEGNRLFRNTDSNGRFHSDWCSMIYSRLMLARNLLSDDGVIAISLDDNEIYNLKHICDEVFGSDNFINNIAIKMSTASGVKLSHRDKKILKTKEYCMLYCKKKNYLTINPQYLKKDRWDNYYEWYVDKIGDECSKWKVYKLDDYLKSIGIHNKDINDKKFQNFYFQNSDKIWQRGRNTSIPKETLQLSKDNWETVFEYKDETGTSQYCYKGRRMAFLKNVMQECIDSTGRIVLDMGTLICDFWQQISTAALFSEGGIEFPNGKKPQLLLITLLRLFINDNDIVLDFFSGSASTAEATMRVNCYDNKNNKFIMVQLPEKTDEKSEAYKAGYKNICEIGKERIRRAGKKILEESGDNSILNSQNSTLDVGFRVLKLADSNMTDVFYSPSDYSQNLLEQFESNIKADRNDLDLLFGCLLDWGLPLSLPYKSVNIDGYTIHNYNDGDLVACFDENIPDEVIKKIAKMQPLRAVFRDSSFANSPSKINVGEIFKLLAPDTRVKVI